MNADQSFRSFSSLYTSISIFETLFGFILAISRYSNVCTRERVNKLTHYDMKCDFAIERLKFPIKNF